MARGARNERLRARTSAEVRVDELKRTDELRGQTIWKCPGSANVRGSGIHK
jgi:hypothetical protein